MKGLQIWHEDGLFHSMRRNKCRIYWIYSPWNLTKIKWKSFRNESRKCFGMLFEEIPRSRKILELSGTPESKFQQFKQREGRATQLVRVQFEHSGVPRILTCCPNGECYSYCGHSKLVPPTFLQIISPLTPLVTSSHSDKFLSVMWRSTPFRGLTLHDQNCQNFYNFQQYAATRYATFLLALLGGSGSHLGLGRDADRRKKTGCRRRIVIKEDLDAEDRKRMAVPGELLRRAQHRR